jgi:ABC-type branched-subunit amino acid transport system substrate-binding protein
LAKNAVVVTITPEDDFNDIPAFAKNGPELILLALDAPEAITLAPRLAAAKFLRAAPLWGGLGLGFREVGAAFTAPAVKLNLTIALPVDLADNGSAPVRAFKNAYVNEYKIQPTWISALAYDSLNLAIKAVSATVVTGQISAFLNGHSHHALGAYQLAPGGGGRPPLTLMAVNEESLAHLP